MLRLFHFNFELDVNEAKADGDNAVADEAIEANADETNKADKANEANASHEANKLRRTRLMKLTMPMKQTLMRPLKPKRPRPTKLIP
jgi:hypothetical protein